MLRAMDMTARWRGVSARGLAEAAARPLAVGLAAAALSFVQPAAGLAPFALALLAAALLAGVHPFLPLAGCLAGMFRPEGIQAAVPLGAGAVLLGFQAVCFFRKRRNTVSGGPRSDEAVVSALAGLGVLLPGLPLAAVGPWESLQTVGAVILAAAGAPFFRALMEITPARRHLMPEERVGLIAFSLAAMAGLAEIWTPLGVTAALAGVLIAAPLGAGAGACAGLSAGCALLLAGLPPVRSAAIGMCGMLAGLAPPRQRWLPALILSAALPAMMLLMGTSAADCLCGLAAGAATLALPEKWAQRLKAWLSGEARGACDPDRLAMRLRAESERRLRALSAAFGELSDSYKIEAEIPDEQSLIAEMRRRLCENCSNYAECWVRGDNQTVRFLCQLISEAIDWAGGDCAEPLFGEEMPPDVLRLCRRGRTIPARLGVLLEEFARKRRSEMKRGAVNQLISAQFMQAQLLLGGLADAQARPVRIRGRQAARARAALDRAGIETAEVMALRGERRMEIIASLKREGWTRELAVEAARQLTDVFGRLYAPAESPGRAEMKFVRQPRLRAAASAGCHSRQAGVPSGDSHLIQYLDGDRLLLLISDGMGSGEAAARESAQVVRLLSQFLAADVNRPLALETVNELMLARTDSDMFATVDLCLIDLASGVAEFTKLAACRSLILHAGEVLTVEGGRLPLGILEKVSPSVRRIQLAPGDVILMASDGVIDPISPSALTALLLSSSHLPPDLLTQSILSAAESAADPRYRDDMTVLCARITPRGLCPLGSPAQGL